MNVTNACSKNACNVAPNVNAACIVLDRKSTNEIQVNFAAQLVGSERVLSAIE